MGSEMCIRDRLKNVPEQIQCENYMKNAKIAFGSEDFDAKVDRIVIKGPQGTNVKRICYNLPKVAKFGVCMTKHPDSPQHWGFCSAAAHRQIGGMGWFMKRRISYFTNLS